MDYNELSDEIIKNIDKVSANLKAKILDYIIIYLDKGKLVYNDAIATIENDIINLLKESGYLEAIEPFFNNFKEILNTTIGYYPKISDLNISLSESKAAQYVIDNTNEYLRSTGLKENVINPIVKELRKMILTGDTYSNIKNKIESLLTGEKPIMINYIKQVSIDAFAQYDGALQNEIMDKYKPKYLYYIGGKIDNSRPFCVHMKDKYGNNKIHIDELKASLLEYCPNGEPSEEIIYINGKKRKKGDGMIDGTTIANIDINRGGHRCEHKIRYIIE